MARTFTFDSEVINQNGYCTKVTVEYEVSATKEKQYDTPFGPSYGWRKSYDGIIGVWSEAIVVLESGEKKIDEVCALDFFNKDTSFKKEVMMQIKKDIDSIDF